MQEPRHYFQVAVTHSFETAHSGFWKKTDYERLRSGILASMEDELRTKLEDANCFVLDIAIY